MIDALKEGNSYINEVIQHVSVQRSKMLNDAIYGGIHEIIKDNGIFTNIELNEKAIVRALERQIPKKPEYYGDGYSNGELVYDYARCPACGKDDYEYNIGNWECKYCPDCGQALDWSDADVS